MPTAHRPVPAPSAGCRVPAGAVAGPSRQGRGWGQEGSRGTSKREEGTLSVPPSHKHV